MPANAMMAELYQSLEEAGFSFHDSTLIGVRTFMIPKSHREVIRYNIISKCKSGTLTPRTLEGKKLIQLSK